MVSQPAAGVCLILAVCAVVCRPGCGSPDSASANLPSALPLPISGHSQHYCSHFLDEESEALRDQVCGVGAPCMCALFSSHLDASQRTKEGEQGLCVLVGSHGLFFHSLLLEPLAIPW